MFKRLLLSILVAIGFAHAQGQVTIPTTSGNFTWTGVNTYTPGNLRFSTAITPCGGSTPVMSGFDTSFNPICVANGGGGSGSFSLNVDELGAQNVTTGPLTHTNQYVLPLNQSPGQIQNLLSSVGSYGTVIIQPGDKSTPFVNFAPGGNLYGVSQNVVNVVDNRPVTLWRSATAFGAACDARLVYGTITSGSKSLNIPGYYAYQPNSADIGKAVWMTQGQTAFETTVAGVGTTTPITSYAYSTSTGLLTIVGANSYTVGQVVVLGGLTTGASLNGAVVTITAATSTQFSGAFTWPSNISTTTDAGLVSLASYVGTSITVKTASPFTSAFTESVLIGHDDTTAIANGLYWNGLTSNGLDPQGLFVLPGGRCMTHTQLLGAANITGIGYQSELEGAPGEDVFATADGSTNENQGGSLHIHDFTVNIHGAIDPTKPWTLVNDSGTTAKAALYRPTYANTSIANNALAPGFIIGGFNGVASVTYNSPTFVIPSSETNVPVAGTQVMFPYTNTGLFETTVLSVSGQTVTLNAPYPGTTSAQQEWFAGTNIQHTSTDLPATRTYPLTINLANSIAPAPGYESNFAPYGLLQIGNEQCTYKTLTPQFTTTGPNPISFTGCTGTAVDHPVGSFIAPLNPFVPSYPWPVVPTVNSNDTTPTMASFFPGRNIGNAGFAFPQASGASGNGLGWANTKIENLYFNIYPYETGNGGDPNLQYQENHGQTDFWLVSFPYAIDAQNIRSTGTEYCLEEGVPGVENHHWAAQQPTADGTHWNGYTCHAGYIFDFLAGGQNTVKNFDTYSDVEENGGTGGGFFVTIPLDDQTGYGINLMSDSTFENMYIEPEGGTYSATDGYQPLNEFDGYNIKYTDIHQGGGGTVFIGGQNQTFDKGTFNATPGDPIYNYGYNNGSEHTLGMLGHANAGLSNVSGNCSLCNWGPLAHFNSNTGTFGSGVMGAAQKGNDPEAWSGEDQMAFATGNVSANFPFYTNVRAGYIAAAEMSPGGTSYEPHPMYPTWTFDDSSPSGGFATCNLYATSQPGVCDNYLMDYTGIAIGPGQRITTGYQRFHIGLKSPVVTSVQVSLIADPPQSGVTTSCSAYSLIQAYTTFPVTNTWTDNYVDINIPASDAGCTMEVKYNAPVNSGLLDVAYYDFSPKWGSISVGQATIDTLNVSQINGGGSATNACLISPVYGINGGYVCPAAGFNGTLASTISPTAQSVTFTGSTAGFPSSGCGYINQETICYASLDADGHTLDGLMRGVYGSTAATHNSSSEYTSNLFALGPSVGSTIPPLVVSWGVTGTRVVGINNPTPATYGTAVLDINSGAAETAVLSNGTIQQVNAPSDNLYNQLDSTCIGNNGAFGACITNSLNVLQTNAQNETAQVLGLGGGLTGGVVFTEPATIAAPSISWGGPTGSFSRSYICQDHAGLVPGTVATLSTFPSNSLATVGIPVTVFCPIQAGVLTYDLLRSSGGTSQGILAFNISPGASFNDFENYATPASVISTNTAQNFITGLDYLSTSKLYATGVPTGALVCLAADHSLTTTGCPSGGGGGGGGGMVYPAGPGIAVVNSGGTAWSTTLVPPTSTIVGISDAQTLTNKSIAATEINSGTLPHAQLPPLVSGDIPNNAANTTGTAAAITSVNPVATGGSGLSSVSLNQIRIGVGSNTLANVTLPNCSGATGALSYDNTAQSFGCNATTQSIFLHTLTGATPVIAVSSATLPTFDTEYLAMSVNVTSLTLPASSAVADGEFITVTISQPSSGGPYTLPVGTAGSPLTPGTGTRLVNTVPGGCPSISTSISSTNPSQLIISLAYQASLTEYQVLSCSTTNPTQNSVVEATLNQSGVFGAALVNTVIEGTSPHNSGHFVNLQIISSTGGTCTTPPIFNVFDGASNIGTPVTAPTGVQTKGNATNGAQTLAFSAGDNIGVYISSAGAGCTTDQFSVAAQYAEP